MFYLNIHFSHLHNFSAPGRLSVLTFPWLRIPEQPWAGSGAALALWQPVAPRGILPTSMEAGKAIEFSVEDHFLL